MSSIGVIGIWGSSAFRDLLAFRQGRVLPDVMISRSSIARDRSKRSLRIHRLEGELPEPVATGTP